MAILTLQPDSSTGKDTVIVSGTATTNYGNAATFDFGEDNTATNFIARSLIQFDLSSIPAGSTINTATLTLTLSSAGSFRSSNNRTARIYRMLRPWVELESTWNIAATGVNWGTAGASNTTSDRESTDIGSTTFNTSDSANSEKSFTLTALQVQEMITGGGFTNNGFMVKMDTETNDRYFAHSCEAATASYRPKLVIDYTPPAGGAFLLNFV